MAEDAQPPCAQLRLRGAARVPAIETDGDPHRFYQFPPQPSLRYAPPRNEHLGQPICFGLHARRAASVVSISGF